MHKYFNIEIIIRTNLLTIQVQKNSIDNLENLWIILWWLNKEIKKCILHLTKNSKVHINLILNQPILYEIRLFFACESRYMFGNGMCSTSYTGYANSSSVLILITCVYFPYGLVIIFFKSRYIVRARPCFGSKRTCSECTFRCIRPAINTRFTNDGGRLWFILYYYIGNIMYTCYYYSR